MSHEVVYLTGAPAAGKSSVAKALAEHVSPLQVFDYGAQLLAAVRSGRDIDYDELRRESANLVTPHDVRATDERLIEWTRSERASSHLLIDTHAVTREAFGFRVTAFSTEQVVALAPTMIVCLYVDPKVAAQRINENAEGRLAVDELQAGFHAGLQGSVAVAYGIAVGKPVYFLDATQAVEAVARFIAGRVHRRVASDEKAP